jgi:hypothetical protein
MNALTLLQSMFRRSPSIQELEALTTDEPESTATSSGDERSGQHTEIGPEGLCRRCEDFDIQSFAKSPYRRRGYLLSDTISSFSAGCDFCELLIYCVADVDIPKLPNSRLRFDNDYFYFDPRIYIHMTVSENYSETWDDAKPEMGVNRLLVEIGDRFSDMRRSGDKELCLSADSSKPIITYIS